MLLSWFRSEVHGMENRLFRVYMRTQDHELVRELIVTAANEEQAVERALDHVKASNQGKGERSKEESESLTEILAVFPTSKPYCLRISEIPAGAVRQIVDSLTA